MSSTLKNLALLGVSMGTLVYATKNKSKLDDLSEISDEGALNTGLENFLEEYKKDDLHRDGALADIKGILNISKPVNLIGDGVVNTFGYTGPILKEIYPVNNTGVLARSLASLVGNHDLLDSLKALRNRYVAWTDNIDAVSFNFVFEDVRSLQRKGLMQTDAQPFVHDVLIRDKEIIIFEVNHPYDHSESMEESSRQAILVTVIIPTDPSLSRAYVQKNLLDPLVENSDLVSWARSVEYFNYAVPETSSTVSKLFTCDNDAVAFSILYGRNYDAIRRAALIVEKENIIITETKSGDERYIHGIYPDAHDIVTINGTFNDGKHINGGIFTFTNFIDSLYVNESTLDLDDYGSYDVSSSDSNVDS
jgi:hypothetical protein